MLSIDAQISPLLVQNFLGPGIWYQRGCLELAQGGGTLVFELGVEQIAAADGGDVEACIVVYLISSLRLLSLLLSR